MKNMKAAHLKYVRKKGAFTIDCSTAIFSNEEIEILEKWGHWFQALMDGTLLPFTERQELFIKMTRGNREPFSVYEKAWNKHIHRKCIELEKGDKLQIEYHFLGDAFYSREHARQLRKTLNRVNWEAHRG